MTKNNSHAVESLGIYAWYDTFNTKKVTKRFCSLFLKSQRVSAYIYHFDGMFWMNFLLD